LPINSDGLLGGGARPNFPAGTAGKIDVVATGPLTKSPAGDATLPIALRNNTSKAVAHVDITATARDATGTLVATGTSQEVDPGALQPGEVGLAFIYFEIGSALPPADAAYSFQTDSQPADTSSFNIAPLKITEADISGDTIVGTAVNATGKQIQAPYSVNVYCFDSAGNLASTTGTFANENGTLPPLGTASFTVNFYTTPACPSFLVGSTGFYS
jgi:hypothetical protein